MKCQSKVSRASQNDVSFVRLLD